MLAACALEQHLGVHSRRDGFGCGGVWYWALLTAATTTVTECMTDMASKVPAGVVYAEDLSRPEQRDQRLERGLDLDDGLEDVPVEWMTGVGRLNHYQAPRDIPPRS